MQRDESDQSQADARPSDSSLGSLRHEAKGLLDPEQPDVNAALGASALGALAFGVVAIAAGWHGWVAAIALFFLGSLGMMFAAAIVSALVKSAVRGATGAFLGFATTVAGVGAWMGSVYAPSWLPWSLAAGTGLVYLPLRRASRNGAEARRKEIGLSEQALRQLAALPEKLDPQLEQRLEGALTDYYRISALTRDPLSSDSLVRALGIEEAALHALESLVARSAPVSELLERAAQPTAEAAERSQADKAWQHFVSAADELHETVTHVLGYIATRDDDGRRELEGRTEQLRLVAEAEQELEDELEA